MPKFDASIPKGGGGFGFFTVRSAQAHIATLLLGGPAWAVGYLALGGGESILAVAGGSITCGLTFGIAFIRALGGPALNLVAIFLWCWVGVGTVILRGDISPERIGDLGFGTAFLLSGILVYVLAGIAWARWLGIDRYNAWTRRTYPPAFFHEEEE